MRFLRPEALWLLLAALPIVALHLRRVRRRVLPAASIRLWRDVARSGVGRRGMRRLRESGALALLLLALAALSAALADPVTGEAAGRPRSLVIVVDASVTMNTTDGRGDGEAVTRFAAARGVVSRALQRMGGDDDVTIWLADASPWVAAGPTRDAAAAEAALVDAAPTFDDRSIGVALERVRAARELRRERATILVVTDVPGAAALREDGHDDAVIVAVVGGHDVANAAITSVALSPAGVRVAIAALEGDTGERTLRVTVGDDVVSELPLTLEPGRAIAPEVFVPTELAGRLEARLFPPDAFPEDDANGLVLRRRPPLRLLVTAPGGRVAPFLLEALRALPELVDADTALVATPDAAPDVVAAADVIVADGAAPEALDVAGASPRPYVGFVESGDRIERPLLWGVGSHPVLEGVDLSPLRLEHGTVIVPRAGEVTLVDSAAGPLAIAGERAGVRYVRFGFRAEASTLPLEAAFPLLVRNSLRWVRGGGELPEAVFAGEPLRLADALPPGADEVVLSSASRSRRVALGPDAAEPATPTPRPGESRMLRVGLPGGASIGETVVQWALPEGTPLGGDQAPAPIRRAIAALPAPPIGNAPLRRLAPMLAAAAAALLLLGAALLSTGAPASERATKRGGAVPPAMVGGAQPDLRATSQ